MVYSVTQYTDFTMAYQDWDYMGFQTNVVKPTLVLTLTLSFFNFSWFGPKSQGMSFLSGRTVPH